MEWLTVEENIGYGLRIKHIDKAEIQRRVQDVMEMVGLTKYARFYPASSLPACFSEWSLPVLSLYSRSCF